VALTVADFLAAFPEFQDAPPALLQTTLSRAINYCPDSVWGQGSDMQQEGVFLYCARFLALQPFGRKMNLVKDGKTSYDVDLQRVKYIVTAGLRFT
jgi:hypothetical protein